jgi:hypothetical protein
VSTIRGEVQRQWCDNLAAACQDVIFEPGAKGNLYLGNLYIEDTTGWPDTPGGGSGRWYLQTANIEYRTDDLERLERRLYAYAEGEGYCD